MKPWQGHAIIALLAFSFALQLRAAITPAQPRESWEYKVEAINDDGWKDADILGSQGWDVSSCRRATTEYGGALTECIFKRRK